MNFRQIHRSRLYRKPEPGDEGTGPAPTIDAAPVADTPTAPADAPAADKPATMLEAMSAAFTKPEDPQPGETQAQADARARDALGRFATKPPVDPAAPAAPVKPPTAEELRALPEGLTPKASERFQALANSNRELEAKHQQFMSTIEPFREALQSNGVTQAQFDQATQVVGMINRGDFKGAQTVLQEQLRQIALMTGEPVGSLDPLSDFPDLRARVDNLQLTEADAIELARGRHVQSTRQQQAQRHQQEQRTTQESQQAFQQGQLAVDRFCASRMATDMDFTRIEPLLIEQIKGGLLEGIPPARWAAIVEKTYGLIKQTAAMSRSAPAGGAVLRPSGTDPVKAAPKSGFEAMWGKPRPAGM